MELTVPPRRRSFALRPNCTPARRTETNESDVVDFAPHEQHNKPIVLG